MNNTSSNLLAALEFAWADIQAINTETPDVIITVGSVGRKQINGHFCANAWHVEPKQFGEPANESTEKVHEVLIAAERLDRSARDVFNTLLHESIHSIAQKRDIKDVSGKRHNKKFKQLAEECGMYFDGKAHTTLGYSDVQMDEHTETIFETAIKNLEVSLKLYRRPELVEKETKGPKKYVCGCERMTSFGKKFFEVGPVVCGLCGTEFEAEED